MHKSGSNPTGGRLREWSRPPAPAPQVLGAAGQYLQQNNRNKR